MKEIYSNIPLDEKETIINFDYFKKIMNIYTTRVATMNRLIKILGEPKEKELFEDKISSMEWDISFYKREDIKKVLSLGILIPLKCNMN